jgi:general secretion pathway protein C
MSALGWLEDLRAAPGLQATFARRGPQAAVAVLGALLAVQAGYLLTLQNRGAPAPAGPAAGSASPPARRLQVGSIVGAHLFGVANAPAASDAPLSAAQLVLAGVISVTDPRKGMAIIGPNVATAKLYAVGAALGAGLSLHSVYPDRVLLDRGGTLETLLLPKKLAAAPLPVAAAPPTASPGQRLAALVQGNDAGGLLGGLVRAQPVFNSGKLSGYRIFPGGRNSIASFNQLGLRSGDMITAVNGAPLDDPSHSTEILQTLSSAASATISVQRNGVQQELSLNLETVANDAERVAGENAAAQGRGGAFGAPLGAGRLPGLTLNPGAPAPLEPASTPQPLPQPQPAPN